MGGSLQRGFGHGIGAAPDNDNGFISDIAVRPKPVDEKSEVSDRELYQGTPDTALTFGPCNRLKIEFEGDHLLYK